MIRRYSILLTLVSMAIAQTPAFLGAEGYGAYATGTGAIGGSATLTKAWQTLGTVVGGTGATASYTDPSPFAKAFYRVEFAP